jgi:hypothetical protein
MPGPLGPIAGIVAAVRAARLAQAATRSTGGITGAKTVGKVFAEGKAPPIVPKTQAQINAEGLAKIKEALKIPEKGTPAANKISSQIKKDNASSSEKAGKAFTKISKKTYKN